MSRRIPQTFIHDLLARADLIDVIGTRVTLKRSGSNYKGLCPFHDEKTPSFSVSPGKGFYHCFGCGVHGNAIDFVMAYENRTFPEAVEALAEMLHLEVPVEASDVQRDENAELFDVLREADQVYRRALREHDAAIEYLKGRGIDGSVASRFGIGYAPPGWDTLVGTLGASPAGLRHLVDAGLAKRSEGGRHYDTFRDRIVFPIRDGRGRVLGFGGRVLGTGEPKYLNSPETAVFHKREALYGIHEARQRPGRPERIVIVEGYLDVVALAQFGIEPALATLGTATTAEHIRQLTRLAGQLVFCFDGDRAGRAAAWRAATAALPFAGGSIELKFLLLPDGEDPDSIVHRAGADAFQARLDAALPLSTFLVTELTERTDLSSSDGRAKLIALARPLLDELPAGIYRELLEGELADRIGLPVDRLRAALHPSLTSAEPAPPRRGRERASGQTLMRKIITLIVHYPRAAGELGIVAGIDTVDAPGADLLRRLLEKTAQEPNLLPAQLIEAFRGDPEGRYLNRFAALEPLDDETMAPVVLADSLQRLVTLQQRHSTASAIKERGPKKPDDAGTQ
jgi:DNA primase